MEAENESVIIYQSWFENAAKLGEEKQAIAIMQILRYGLYGDVPDNSSDLCLDLLFCDWKPLVDAAKKKRTGGAPKGNKNAKGNKGGPGRPKKTQPKNTTLNVNGNVNGNGNANNNDHNLPTVGSLAPDNAGNSTLEGEPDWMRGDDE